MSKVVLITGAKGFIGRNLIAHLRPRTGLILREYDLGNSDLELQKWVAESDAVVHLAGVNRPEHVSEFELGNVKFTSRLCDLLREAGHHPQIIFASSVQAVLKNDYGISKRRAEAVVQQYASDTGSYAAIFRLKNVFGKWCRPNYNSVAATFCHNIAHDLPIQISDPQRMVALVHVDDVVKAFTNEMDSPRHYPECHVVPDPVPFHATTLGDLADRLRTFREMQRSLTVPDFSLRFNQQLYSTFLSYVEPCDWEYRLRIREDQRGTLAEFIKSPGFGQIFISRTHPGVTRGNHYHHVKAEKFMVVVGQGLIRFRHIEGDEILQFRVRGEDYRVVEIPPGYTHSITNVGSSEMITLFWASEILDHDRPDTFLLNVDSRAAA